MLSTRILKQAFQIDYNPDKWFLLTAQKLVIFYLEDKQNYWVHNFSTDVKKQILQQINTITSMLTCKQRC